MAEWSIAPVLKTGGSKGSVSSNLTASAKIPINPCSALTWVHYFSAKCLKSVIIAGMQKSTDFKAVFLYGLTIFLSAFLLFQVQPMMGKMILPWFGGSASVWTTCMLFFQALLLLGYLYTHWVVSHLSPLRQSLLHMVLLATCVLLLLSLIHI